MIQSALGFQHRLPKSGSASPGLLNHGATAPLQSAAPLPRLPIRLDRGLLCSAVAAADGEDGEEGDEDPVSTTALSILNLQFLDTKISLLLLLVLSNN